MTLLAATATLRAVVQCHPVCLVSSTSVIMPTSEDHVRGAICKHAILA